MDVSSGHSGWWSLVFPNCRVVFGQELGFLSIAIVDLIFGVTEGILLYLAMQDKAALANQSYSESV